MGQLGLPNATNPASESRAGEKEEADDPWIFCRCDINKNMVKKGKM